MLSSEIQRQHGMAILCLKAMIMTDFSRAARVSAGSCCGVHGAGPYLKHEFLDLKRYNCSLHVDCSIL